MRHAINGHNETEQGVLFTARFLQRGKFEASKKRLKQYFESTYSFAYVHISC